MDISIFNLNCWLLPWPFSVDHEVRRAHIVDLILKRNPDIITLQEVWSNTDLKYFQQRLPTYHCVSSGTRLYNQTGLVTFVKKKPVAVRVTFFKLSFWHNATEWVARKGYLQAEITVDGATWTIVNTHLHAAILLEAKRIARTQLTELLGALSGLNVLLCGDLNLRADQFEGINQERFLRLCDLQDTIETVNPYTRKMFKMFFSANESKKYDHILTNMAITPSEYEVIRSPLISDHYAQYCRVSLDPAFITKTHS